MTTTDKLTHIKELLATCFMVATERSLAQGLQFGYKSYAVETPLADGTTHKSWNFDFLIKELGYPETTIQQLRFDRPNNIDAKNMEYNVCIEALAAITQGALMMWYEVGKMLAQEKELQKTIIDETKKDNIASYKSK